MTARPNGPGSDPERRTGLGRSGSDKANPERRTGLGRSGSDKANSNEEAPDTLREFHLNALADEPPDSWDAPPDTERGP